MNTVTMKAAPQGARLLSFGRELSAGNRALINSALAQAGAGMSISAAADDPPAPPPEPAVAPPTDSDRLDAHDVTLAEHAARLATLERKAAADPGADAEGAGGASAASRSAITSLDAGAFYARMRNGGAQAAAMPAIITGADGRQMLDAHAILRRHGEHLAASAMARTTSATTPAPGKPAPAGTTILNAREINARLNASRSS